MINLLIVEDEQVIRNGLEKHVPWKALGVDMVRTAENAEEGIKICENYQPDIIVSDIKMPGMNGVELCRLFREKFVQCEIIFISGYSDKEYLKAAIALGAVNYVEKPIDISELSQAVQKAVENVKKNSRHKENIIHNLLQPVKGTKRDLQLYGAEAYLKQDKAFRIVLFRRKEVFRNMEELIQLCRDTIQDMLGENNRELHFIADYVEENCFAFLFSTASPELFDDTSVSTGLREKFFSKRTERDKWFVAIGKYVYTLEEISESYRSAQHVMQALAYKGWNNFAGAEEQIVEYQESISQEEQYVFRRKLVERQKKEAEEQLLGWYERLVQAHAAMTFQVRNIYYILDSIVAQADDMTHMNRGE